MIRRSSSLSVTRRSAWGAGASLSVAVTGATSYQFIGAASLYASVTFAAAGQLASYLVSSAANDEAPVLIYP